jgi:hypothetical protein
MGGSSGWLTASNGGFRHSPHVLCFAGKNTTQFLQPLKHLFASPTRDLPAPYDQRDEKGQNQWFFLNEELSA